MGFKDLLDDTKEEALNLAKKKIVSMLKPLLIKGLSILLIIMLVASSTIAIFDALGEVISGIITGAINAVKSVTGKFSRWLINTGIKDDSDNYWINFNEPYESAKTTNEDGEEIDQINIEYEVPASFTTKEGKEITIKPGTGNIEQFTSDDNLGIKFRSIYGLNENYKRVNSDAEYVLGYGAEGIALFRADGGLLHKNTDLKDAIEFYKIAIMDTGVVLSDENETKIITYDFNLKITSQDVKGRTLPDLYLENLYSTGLSLDNLRVVVGGVDEKLTVDEILADVEQKEKAEKYIKEFLRADLISSSTHKTSSKTNVDPDDSDKFDGGVYIWRTTLDMYAWDEELNATMQSKYTDVGTKKLRFVPYDVFHKTFEEDMGSGEKDLVMVDNKGWKDVYTVNEAGNIEIFIFDLYYSGPGTGVATNLFGREVTTRSRIGEIDYKEYIRKYTQPFEFLMAVAYTCQNPEYAYHLAYLGRDTMIDLVICDEYEVSYSEETLTGHIKRVNITETKYGPSQDGHTMSVEWGPNSLPDEEDTTPIDLGARTSFTLKGAINAFVVRANSWNGYLKATLVKNATVPVVSPPYTRYNVNEEYGAPEATPGETVYEYKRDDDGNITNSIDPDRYTVRSWNNQKIIDTAKLITKTYKVTFNVEDIVEGYKVKAFYGLLRTADKNYEEDKCETEEDIINHIKEIEPDEQGVNVSYKLQATGMEDAPINILANERLVLYRQIETFGNAFYKETETGEREYSAENGNGDRIILAPEETETNNYQWLYAYLDYCFKKFYLGKFQPIEELPDDMNEFFGDWSDENWSPSGTGPMGSGHVPPPGERVDESNFVHYSQQDPAWRNKYYNGNGTFWHHACMMCSMAMVERNLYGRDYDPPRLYDDYRSTYGNDYRPGWSVMYDHILNMCESKNPIVYTADANGLQLALRDVSDGAMAIIHCYYNGAGNPSCCHAIVISAYDDAGIHLHDPWSMDGSYTIVPNQNVPPTLSPITTYDKLLNAMATGSQGCLYVFPPN